MMARDVYRSIWSLPGMSLRKWTKTFALPLDTQVMVMPKTRVES